MNSGNLGSVKSWRRFLVGVQRGPETMRTLKYQPVSAFEGVETSVKGKTDECS